MRLKEQRLWDRMKANIDGAGMWLRRIENRVGEGDPDVEAISLTGGVVKVELKAVLVPPRRATTSLLGEANGLNSDQRNFMLKWLQYGQRGYILVGVGERHSVEQFLINGTFADQVNAWSLNTIREMAAAQSWPSIAQILRTR